MKLHIDLDSSHPAYEWLEKQADKIGARGHFGTHIDCYSKTPSENNYNLPVFILDCREGMPTLNEAKKLPSLEGQALLLYTDNLNQNDYGSKAYFNDMDTSLSMDILEEILKANPQLILIDSYGIGRHGEHHQSLDVRCEQSDCFVIENILVKPEMISEIRQIQVSFDLDYPSTGKPCEVTYSK